MDKKFRVPRVWSNRELENFSHTFSGRAVNVSGWKDQDKEGRKYRDYFSNVSEYWITNYKSEARGFQGDQENEIFLNLAEDLDESMNGKFDVVFNHTVLEHIFEVGTAFTNLCNMSKDIVILIVPFLQEQHADYGDYWRFTPQAVDKLFSKNGFETLYISANNSSDASIYVFCVASKLPHKWTCIRQQQDNMRDLIYKSEGMIGCNVIKSTSFIGLAKNKLKYFFKK